MKDEEKKFYENEAWISWNNDRRLPSGPLPFDSDFDTFKAGFLAGIEFAQDKSRTSVLGTKEKRDG